MTMMKRLNLLTMFRRTDLNRIGSVLLLRHFATACGVAQQPPRRSATRAIPTELHTISIAAPAHERPLALVKHQLTSSFLLKAKTARRRNTPQIVFFPQHL